jgi:ribosomal protein L11 methyltransferase
MEAMLDLDLRGKKVMDFGSGTGILAILAHKLGAREVWATDNDPQCIENAEENFMLNECRNIHLTLGGIHTISGVVYDLILANITRNTIIENLAVISLKLQPGGLLIAGGFYEEDLGLLNEKASEYNLSLLKTKTKDRWTMAIYKKTE